MSGARLTRITGALAEAEPMPAAGLNELVRLGDAGLLGEVIRVEGARAMLQVYEDTTGLATGGPAVATGSSLMASLGPGLLGSILDGVGRPLLKLAEESGQFIRPGRSAETLDGRCRWEFRPVAAAGQAVAAGDCLGIVVERGAVEHRVMLPPGRAGTIASIQAGHYAVTEPFGQLEDGTPLQLAHQWPVRVPRPVRERLPTDRPFITGQRVFDLLFPAAEGGTIAVPGGFGTGKTIIEHSLAKYAEADIVVYIGCGERGNEMAEAVHDFPRLIDHRTGRSIMDRTVMVVNTSNMPVAAREASVYLGVTIAEYYRDMGFRVALLADSLSRWAEALREIGARLGEMPGEEGYPTYLGSRIAQFCERAGRVTALGTPAREGSLTIVAAVSPPGGDLSEPVTQAIMRVAGSLWALDAGLAHQRQFPAVDWQTSYSLHANEVSPRLASATGPDWPRLRAEALALLQRGRELREIAGLVGPEALQDADRLQLEAARIVQDQVLGQSAFDPNDATSSLARTYRLARLALDLHDAGSRALQAGALFEQLDLGSIQRALAALRSTSEETFESSAAGVAALIANLAPPPPP